MSAAEAQPLLTKYVQATLGGWQQIDEQMGNKPSSFSVYLNFTARYEDGRGNSRTAPYTDFVELSEAVDYTDRCTAEILQELQDSGP